MVVLHLPFIEETASYEAPRVSDIEASVSYDQNPDIFQRQIDTFLCPSAPIPPVLDAAVSIADRQTVGEF